MPLNWQTLKGDICQEIGFLLKQRRIIKASHATCTFGFVMRNCKYTVWSSHPQKHTILRWTSPSRLWQPLWGKATKADSQAPWNTSDHCCTKAGQKYHGISWPHRRSFIRAKTIVKDIYILHHPWSATTEMKRHVWKYSKGTNTHKIGPQWPQTGLQMENNCPFVF